MTPYDGPHPGCPLPFALRAGQVVEPAEVPNGLACGCVCPGCGHALIAYNAGRQRSPYFGHAPGGDCGVGALESALHLAAKQVLRDAPSGTLQLPAAIVTPSGLVRPRWQQDRWVEPDWHRLGQTLGASRLATVCSLQEECEVRFETAPAPRVQGALFDDPPEGEGGERFRTLRADVLVEEGEGRLWIEILVAHAVGLDKQRLLQANEWPALEIDLSPWLTRPVTLADVRRAVLEAEEGKRWLSYPGAIQAASAILVAAEAARQAPAPLVERASPTMTPPAPSTGVVPNAAVRRSARQDFYDDFEGNRLFQEQRRKEFIVRMSYEKWCELVRRDRIEVSVVMVGSERAFPEFGDLADRNAFARAQAEGAAAVDSLTELHAEPHRWFAAGRVGRTPQEAIRGKWVSDASWPALKGSAKMITWAEAIRREYLHSHPSDIESVSRSEAAWWIDHRQKLGK